MRRLSAGTSFSWGSTPASARRAAAASGSRFLFLDVYWPDQARWRSRRFSHRGPGLDLDFFSFLVRRGKGAG